MNTNERRSYQMIARLWRGWTSIENAEAYEKLLREQVLPGLRQIDGYRGGYILRPEGNDEVEFVVMYLFESLEAMLAFAGAGFRFKNKDRIFRPRQSSHLLPPFK